MTKEERAEAYVKKNCDDSLYSFRGQELQEAFLAGYETGKDEAEADLATVAYMQGSENQKKKTDRKLNKATEILKVVLNKWKEERWILQSEKEVKMIENVMKEAEEFLKE